MSEQAIIDSTAASAQTRRQQSAARRLAIGFGAGFIAVLVFHQPLLALLSASGFVAAKAYSTAATAPFGVPQIFSTAFWGGVWGVVFAWVEPRLPRKAGYWLAALAFGAALPSLVAWFVVAPLKGAPILAGGDLPRIVTALLVNGAWGVGCAFLYWLYSGGLRSK
jgi:hypothetical protein